MKIKEIKTRRSIRNYQEKIIPEKTIKEILEAALYTPTTMNTQAFKILVIRRDFPVEKIKKIISLQRHAFLASHNVFIFTRKKSAVDKKFLLNFLGSKSPEEREKFAKMMAEFYKTSNDISGIAYSVAISLVLEAKAHKIGSTIYSGFDKNEATNFFKKYVDVKKYEPMLGISFGFQKGDGAIRSKRIPDLLEKIIFLK